MKNGRRDQRRIINNSQWERFRSLNKITMNLCSKKFMISSSWKKEVHLLIQIIFKRLTTKRNLLSKTKINSSSSIKKVTKEAKILLQETIKTRNIKRRPKSFNKTKRVINKIRTTTTLLEAKHLVKCYNVL